MIATAIAALAFTAGPSARSAPSLPWRSRQPMSLLSEIASLTAIDPALIDLSTAADFSASSWHGMPSQFVPDAPAVPTHRPFSRYLLDAVVLNIVISGASSFWPIFRRKLTNEDPVATRLARVPESRFGWIQADLRSPLPPIEDLEAHPIGFHGGRPVFLCSQRATSRFLHVERSADFTEHCERRPDIIRHRGAPIFSHALNRMPRGRHSRPARPLPPIRLARPVTAEADSSLASPQMEFPSSSAPHWWPSQSKRRRRASRARESASARILAHPQSESDMGALSGWLCEEARPMGTCATYRPRRAAPASRDSFVTPSEVRLVRVRGAGCEGTERGSAGRVFFGSRAPQEVDVLWRPHRFALHCVHLLRASL